MRKLVSLLSPLLLLACGDGPAQIVADDIEISVYRGDNQTLVAGSPSFEPLIVRVVDGNGKVVENVRVEWRVVSGVADLMSFLEEVTLSPAVTATDVNGLARVRIRSVVPGQVVVKAAVVDRSAAAVSFTANLAHPTDVIIRFSPTHDCTANDPSIFAGPNGTAESMVKVGASVDFIYNPNLHPTCTARVMSTSAPTGGSHFDSGLMAPGMKFRFIPTVAGRWAFTEVIHGGSSAFTAVAP